jgi:hypothetical protein
MKRSRLPFSRCRAPAFKRNAEAGGIQKGEFGQVQNDPSNIRLLGPADCKVEPLHRRYVHLTGESNGYRVALPLCLDL